MQWKARFRDMNIKYHLVILMLIIKLVPQGKELMLAVNLSICLPIISTVIFQ